MDAGNVLYTISSFLFAVSVISNFIYMYKYKELVKIESKRIDEEKNNLQEYQRKSDERLLSNKQILESINKKSLADTKILKMIICENEERVTAINKLDIPDYIHIDKNGSIFAVKGDIAERVLTHDQVLGMFLIMKSLWGTSDVRSKD